jgi:hypothetical protein
MPHAFKATPGHPAVDYLVRLHADLGGKILENKKEGERLAESMRCVEHVIRLFDPAYPVSRIAARKRHKGNPWYRRGTILPAALDVLRKSPAPLTARDIADRLLMAKGARDDTSPKALRTFIAAVQTSLVNQNDKTIVRVGEGMPARWKAV